MDLDLQDDAFSDADLDDVPINTFNELEQRAIQASQPPAVTTARDAAQSPYSDYGLGEDAEVINLDDNIDQEQNLQSASVYPPADEVTRREQWRHDRYSRANPQPPLRSHNLETITVDRRVGQRFTENAVYTGGASAETPSKNVGFADLESLQSRVSELEREKDALRKAAEEAKAAVLSKTGEISIIRSNHDKVQKEYERRMAVMQKLHADELQKQKHELDMMKKEREKVHTDNRFLEHSLAEEARTRTIKKGTTGRSAGGLIESGSPVTTPKKNRTMAFRDGFEDEEVFFQSPTKARERSKTVTPKAGTKRKRDMPEDNSGLSLPLAELAVNLHEQAPRDTMPNAKTLQQGDDAYDIVSLVLNHRNVHDGSRTIERLSRSCFPSGPTTTVASVLYDMLGSLPKEHAAKQNAKSTVCGTLLVLWTRCLDEAHYEPLFDISALLADTFTVTETKLATPFLPEVIEKCLATIDLVALPTVKTLNSQPSTPRITISLPDHIDPADYMDILSLVSLHYSVSTTNVAPFWSLIPFEFPLLMLHRAQPFHLMTSTLRLLNSSILPTSFGPILSTGSGTPQQAKKETDLLDRLVVLLFETPASPPDHQLAHDPSALLSLRADVLSLLVQLCVRSPHGGRALASHRYAFGRLTRFLHELVMDVYAVRPDTHKLACTLVNTTVLLLAHLTACHADVLDVRARLMAIPAGSYKYLVALSRIAFRDGLTVVEEGISAEAADAAHRMLDEHLSPEEGEAVVQVFSSGRG